jgi:hypothetical protein
MLEYLHFVYALIGTKKDGKSSIALDTSSLSILGERRY